MNDVALLFWGLIAVAAVFSCLAIRTTWVSSRFAAVTAAQYKRATANSILATAYSGLRLARLTNTDERQSLTAIADAELAVKVAEAAVQRAEARLPRGRSRSNYFASKSA
jgi:hypothetical protein